MPRPAIPHSAPHDPRGLIRDSFRIEGIKVEDCRSIFFDWVLGLPDTTDMRVAIEAMLAEYADMDDVHPMKVVLREGLVERRRTRPSRRRAARR